jgi:hypothetical protein
MKTSFKFLIAIVTSTVILFSCEKTQELEPILNSSQKSALRTTSNISDESMKNVSSNNILAVGCEVYSLVLAGKSGTPHLGGLDSYLANVDMITGNTTATSHINILGIPVKSVTGITKAPTPATSPPAIFGVTGINSNFAGSLLKINPTTGLAINAGSTKMGNVNIFLQDIEYCFANNLYYAIIEGTNRIVSSPNGLSWVNVPTVIPTTVQLNGLTFRTIGNITKLWVIAGAGNTFCGANYGNMWELALNGAFISINNYNAANTIWTNKELGLDFNSNTGCISRNFVVGSASGVLSNNLTLCPALPALIGTGQIEPTYDYAKK